MRKRYSIATTLLAAICMTALLSSGPIDEAQSRVVAVKPSKVAKHGVVFRVNGAERLEIRRARLILNHAKRRIVRRVGLRKVRRGLRRGTVRLRLPRAYRRILIRARRAQLRRLSRQSRNRKQATDRRPTHVAVSSAKVAASAKIKTPAPRLVIAVEPEPGKRAAPVSAAPPADDCGSGSFGRYGDGAFPAACWRPYNDSSPFNQALPSNPRLAAKSDAIVSQLTAWGKVQNMLGGHSGRSDYGHPIYYSDPGDPSYTVRCEEWASSCEVHGAQVHIPRGARPAGGGDGHLAVIDQSSGVEYDFWQVRSIPANGGVISVSHGGMTRIDGDGMGSNATAAHFGLAAGIIRGEEMFAGEIDHALFAQVKCTSGSSVAPAARGTSAASCDQFGISTENAPPLGARLWLAMSEAQIESLRIPDWHKVILRAMARYGVIIGDSMGGNSSWGLQAASGEAYTSLGAADPWQRFGASVGAPTYEGGYVFDIDSGVDWNRYLKVVDPCVSAGTC